MPAPPPANRAPLFERLRTLPTLNRNAAPIPVTLRSQPEDFQVRELPAYEPCGEGEHLYLQIEKSGLNTQDAVRDLARALDLDPKGAGWAGLKDRHARTTQWVSFHAPSSVAVSAGQVFGPNLRVCAAARHGNKLRTGHLHGNHFRLCLRDVDPARDAELRQIVASLQSQGMPNYFGEQRFGHGASNLHGALDWLVEGGRPPRAPFKRKMFMSTWQSAIFNDVLAARIESGTLATALAGDVMGKEPTGGLFVCEDPKLDGPRVAAWEISPSGPMFGAKMRSAEGHVAHTEQESLAHWGGSPELLARHKGAGQGTRRPLRVRPRAVELAREGDAMWLSFELPAGSYATMLVREFTQKPLWEAGS